jgi:hypothetical protein
MAGIAFKTLILFYLFFMIFILTNSSRYENVAALANNLAIAELSRHNAAVTENILHFDNQLSSAQLIFNQQK